MSREGLGSIPSDSGRPWRPMGRLVPIFLKNPYFFYEMSILGDMASQLKNPAPVSEQSMVGSPGVQDVLILNLAAKSKTHDNFFELSERLIHSALANILRSPLTVNHQSAARYISIEL